MKSNDLASFLKSKRIASGLSQRDIADKLGYSTPQFISNWERGVSRPPVNALKKLGAFYAVDSEQLFAITLNSVINEVTRDLRRKFASSKVKH